MEHIGTALTVTGLIFDVVGATIVLSPDWKQLHKNLVKIGNNCGILAGIPVIGIVFGRLNYLSELEYVKRRVLSVKMVELNRKKRKRHLEEGQKGFDALKKVLTEDLDVLPQFNRVSVGTAKQGHTNRQKVGDMYLNTSLYRILEDRFKSGFDIEDWLLRDFIDDITIEEAKQAVEERRKRIIMGTGGRLLIIGFSLQIIAKFT